MSTKTRKRTVAEKIIEIIEKIYQKPCPRDLKEVLEAGEYRRVLCYKEGKLKAELIVHWR